MNHSVEEIIALSVAADIGRLPLVQKITREVARQCGFGEEKASRISLALEEIFHYCVRMIRTGTEPSRISLAYRQGPRALDIQVEYRGPRGALEKHFMAGRERSFKLTSFEAIGLRLADRSIDDLTYTPFHDGTNRFTMTIRLSDEKAP